MFKYKISNYNYVFSNDERSTNSMEKKYSKVFSFDSAEFTQNPSCNITKNKINLEIRIQVEFLNA